MIELKVCPSTLASGYNSYSPRAVRELFDGASASYIFDGKDPASDNETAQDAINNIGRISLSGVQPKFSAILDKVTNKLRFTKEGERGTYILKPSPVSYHIFCRQYCTANEHLTMQLASQAYDIQTANNGLCFFDNDKAAYITKRYDVKDGMKLPQEDFASILGYTKAQGGSDFKYCNSSYEECAQVIKEHVSVASIDLLRFFRMIIFNFITLNDDAHLKNFSLLYDGNEYRLTPAYDLMNTSLHLSQPRLFALDKGLFSEGMHLSDVKTIKRNDFLEFARRIGISARIANRELDKFASVNPKEEFLIENSFLSEDLKKQYRMSVRYRKVLLRD